MVFSLGFLRRMDLLPGVRGFTELGRAVSCGCLELGSSTLGGTRARCPWFYNVRKGSVLWLSGVRAGCWSWNTCPRLVVLQS